jgi:glycosyltransferase involved in cell wall biosynthesis
MESLARCRYIDARSVSNWTHWHAFRRMAASAKPAAQELVLCRKADEVVCVSKSDAAFLRRASRSKNICSLETGISGIEFPKAIEDRSSELAPENKENAILYLAYFGSGTNIVALKWYLENVHPLVKNRVPGYVLRVVGRGDLSAFNEYRDDAVDFVGEVPFVGPQIEKAKVGIAPALDGAGFRGKINQYAIFGVPSVASPIAATGLAYKSKVDIFIAEKPEDFADQCVLLLTDNELNRQMGRQARETALLNYTWESKMDAIKNIYGLNGAIR